MTGKPTASNRRKFVLTGSAIAAATASAAVWHQWSQSEPVFIARNQKYGGQLVARSETVCWPAIWTRVASAKAVLLKPNLVEPSRQSPHIDHASIGHPGGS